MTRKNSRRIATTLLVVLGIVVAWGPVAHAAEPFIGQVQIFGFSFPPRGWAHCDGQILPISSYTALYSLLGTTYGGDGRTTFGLPDLRGRVSIHPGNGPGVDPIYWGQKGGYNSVILSVAQMPAHSHTATVRGAKDRGNQEVPTGNVWATKSRDRDYSDVAPDVDMMAGTVVIGNAGAGQAHPNMQPSLGVSHIIALVGLYPSRN